MAIYRGLNPTVARTTNDITVLYKAGVKTENGCSVLCKKLSSGKYFLVRSAEQFLLFTNSTESISIITLIPFQYILVP